MNKFGIINIKSVRMLQLYSNVVFKLDLLPFNILNDMWGIANIMSF